MNNLSSFLEEKKKEREKKEKRKGVIRLQLPYSWRKENKTSSMTKFRGKEWDQAKFSNFMKYSLFSLYVSFLKFQENEQSSISNVPKSRKEKRKMYSFVPLCQTSFMLDKITCAC